MKRYINAMSHKRKTALNKLSHNSENIELNIARCIVYGTDCPAYNHWIQKITTWIVAASKLHDDGGYKFSAEEYQDNLFDCCGTSTSDSKSSLEDLQKEVKDNPEYDDFTITHELIVEMRSASSAISADISKYLSKLDRYEVADETIVQRILNNEIKDALNYD